MPKRVRYIKEIAYEKENKRQKMLLRTSINRRTFDAEKCWKTEETMSDALQMPT
jgi:hypothetical protein